MPPSTLLATARDLADAGCCVIPTRTDGSKAPAVDWKHYQHQHPTADQLAAWFAPRDDGTASYDGLGVVCGQVSGGLEMLELEGRAADLGTELRDLLVDHDAADLWDRLCTGYLEQSPSGGYHWLYRVEDEHGSRPGGNTRLARRPSTPQELDEWKATEHAKVPGMPQAQQAARAERIEATTEAGVPQVLIETRGEGGFVVLAPSAGRTHPTGAAWVMLAGGPASIPTISGDERDLLHALAQMLDQMPTQVQPLEPLTATAATSYDGDQLRPGDDFNARATWEEILTPHGWQRVKRLGAGWGWVRPGKHPLSGISATTGTAADGIDRLYVFSTSTDFDTETPYSKFAAHAILNHAGDLSAAASALRGEGYGTPQEAGPSLTIAGVPPRAPSPVSVGHPGDTEADPDAVERAHYSLTDDGNALRLVDTYGAQVRYVPQRGSWLRWDTHRWVWDEAESVRELARSIARRLPDGTKAELSHRHRSHSASSVTAMVRLAQTDPRVVVHVGTLDARPYELNTPGGIVDLRTGALVAPDPTHMHTRSTNVAPDFTAPAPRWEKFLADTFAGDPELTTYVQRMLGVSLIGEVIEQMLPFAFGSGANGKSTLLNTVQRIIGLGDTGYAITAPADLFTASRENAHPTEIARLSGARLVVTSEVEDGQRFAEAKVKQLTGKDVLAGRFMGKDFFSFVPTHTPWLLANHQPAVKAGGPAFWRRMALLPFAHTVPAAERDPHLEDHLVNVEAPAILAWAIRGAADYLTGGLAVPASVVAATAAYERDQDGIGRFVDELCETGSPGDQDYRSKVSDVRGAYESWCHTEGESPANVKAFTTALRSRFGVWSERTRDARWYAGIRLRESVEMDAETLRWDQR